MVGPVSSGMFVHSGCSLYVPSPSLLDLPLQVSQGCESPVPLHWIAPVINGPVIGSWPPLNVPNGLKYVAM